MRWCSEGEGWQSDRPRLVVEGLHCMRSNLMKAPYLLLGVLVWASREISQGGEGICRRQCQAGKGGNKMSIRNSLL